MAGYQEILNSLRETQSFFRKESREYKDFRDALSALEKAMHSAGGDPLSANRLLELRELTAKAREAWGKYFGEITGGNWSFRLKGRIIPMLTFSGFTGTGRPCMTM